MPFQDYHRRGLCPEVWRSDTELRGTVRSGLLEALQRFDPARAFLVGALTGHYYDAASSLDVLIQIEPEHLEAALIEAQLLEQRFVRSTTHPLHVVPVSIGVAAKVLQQKFGPLYDLNGIWLGTRASTKAELAEPKALLRRINWRIFKARKSLEDFTKRFWEIEEAVFSGLMYAEQLEVLEELGYRVRRLDNYVDRSLVQEPREVWKATEQLESALLAALENSSSVVETLRAEILVPTRTKEIVLQRLRYEDLLTTLRDAAAEQKELDTITQSTKSLPINAGMRNDMTSTSFHPVVTLRGGSETLDLLGAKLASKNPKKVLRSSPNTLVLTEVSMRSAQRIAAMAPQLGVEIDLGEVTTVEVPLPQPAPKVAAADPALDPGKWYFAEAKEDVYPFVQARELTAKGWAVELLTASNAVPTRKVLDAEELASFGLRPATSDDFTAMDLPVPQSQHLVQATPKVVPLPKATRKPGPKHLTRKGPEKLVRVDLPAATEIEHKVDQISEGLTSGQYVCGYRSIGHGLYKVDICGAGGEVVNSLEVETDSERPLYATAKKPVGSKPVPKRSGTKRLAVAPNLASLRQWNLSVPGRTAAAGAEGAAVWDYWQRKTAAANTPKFRAEQAADVVLKQLGPVLQKVSMEELQAALLQISQGKSGSGKLAKYLNQIVQAAAEPALAQLAQDDSGYDPKTYLPTFLKAMLNEVRRSLERGEVKAPVKQKQEKKASPKYLRPMGTWFRVRYVYPDAASQPHVEYEQWGGAPTREAIEAHVGDRIDWDEGTAEVVGIEELDYEGHEGEDGVVAWVTFVVEPQQKKQAMRAKAEDPDQEDALLYATQLGAAHARDMLRQGLRPRAGGESMPAEDMAKFEQRVDRDMTRDEADAWYTGFADTFRASFRTKRGQAKPKLAADQQKDVVLSDVKALAESIKNNLSGIDGLDNWAVDYKLPIRDLLKAAKEKLTATSSDIANVFKKLEAQPAAATAAFRHYASARSAALSYEPEDPGYDSPPPGRSMDPDLDVDGYYIREDGKGSFVLSDPEGHELGSFSTVKVALHQARRHKVMGNYTYSVAMVHRYDRAGNFVVEKYSLSNGALLKSWSGAELERAMGDEGHGSGYYASTRRADYEFLDEPPQSQVPSMLNEVVFEITQLVHDEVEHQAPMPGEAGAGTLSDVISDATYNVLSALPDATKVVLGEALDLAYVPYSPDLEGSDESFENLAYAVMPLVRDQYEHDLAAAYTQRGAGVKQADVLNDAIYRNYSITSTLYGFDLYAPKSRKLGSKYETLQHALRAAGEDIAANGTGHESIFVLYDTGEVEMYHPNGTKLKPWW